MITKAIAMAASHGQIFHHVSLKNRDGSPVRCRVNGKCKTWATRPEEWRLPVKYGLKECFYLEPWNADKWEKAL